MSSECLAWALRARVQKATTKLLLLIVADLANHVTGEVFASIAYLEEATGLSRPTVLAALKELCVKAEEGGLGVLERTADRKGRTQQIPVYLFAMSAAVPLIPRKATGKKIDPLPKGVKKPAETGQLFDGEQVKNLHTEPSSRNQEGEPIPPPPLEGHPHGGDLVMELTEHVAHKWARLAADFPNVQAMRVMSVQRKSAVKKRARDLATETGVPELAIWDAVFDGIRGDSWLRGEKIARGHDKPLNLSIDYILRAGKMLQIIERSIHNERHTAATSDATTGRRFGPAEQAGRDALQRYFAAQQPGR